MQVDWYVFIVNRKRRKELIIVFKKISISVHALFILYTYNIMKHNLNLQWLPTLPTHVCCAGLGQYVMLWFSWSWDDLHCQGDSCLLNACCV